jgi:hypothetical protein
MKEEWTEEELMKAVELTVEKAKIDEELAKLVLEDPRTAISQVTGKECPPGASIEFINLGIGIRVSFPGMTPEEPGEGQPGQVALRRRRRHHCRVVCNLTNCVDLWECWGQGPG